MPLIENDMIYAFLDADDRYHDVAENIFNMVYEGKMKVEISTVTLLELELIYKSNKLEHLLLEHIAALSALLTTRLTPLTTEIILSSIYLRKTHGLTFFDSHYAATALNNDRVIISKDRAYSDIPGLTLIDPETL